MTTPVQPQLPQVRPGDLITADFMNRLVNALAELDTRVTAIENGVEDGPLITRIDPAGTIRIGTIVSVRGRNLGPIATTSLTLDNSVTFTAAHFESGTGDSIINIRIPTLPNVPESGRIVPLRIMTLKGQDDASITVFPAQATIPMGDVFVSLIQGPVAVIQASASSTTPNRYLFKYRIRAVVDMQETYDLGASITPSGWQIEFVDDETSPAPVASPAITLPAATGGQGAAADVWVRVTAPTGLASGSTAAMQITATSRRNNLLKRTGTTTLTVGQNAPLGQTEIAVACSSYRLPSGTIGAVTGPVDIPPGTPETRLDFAINVTHAGDYTVQILTVAPGWTAHLAASPTEMQRTVTAPSDTLNVPFSVFVAHPAAPTATEQTNITVRVTRVANSAVTLDFAQPVRVLAPT